MRLLGQNILTVLGKVKFSNLTEFQMLELPHGIKIEGYLTKTVLSGSMSASVSKVSKDCIYCFLN
jgi:hypothetical protein